MRGDIIEKLFLQYYNDALLYTLTLSKNKSVAEDIVSAAFYKALETADESVTNFKYWLLRVCRNLYYNYHKRKKRSAELSENMQDEREEVLDKIIADEEYGALYRAIELIPPHLKEVIMLFYFEDMSINDIAKLIDKRADAVKVMLFRARESLKKLLENKNEF